MSRWLSQWPARRVFASKPHADVVNSASTSARQRRKPAWLVREVLRLKVLMGHAGCRQIAATFNRLHSTKTGERVSKSFVADCIKANQYALQCLRREMRAEQPRHVRVNAVWAMDLTFHTDAAGKQQAALGILDHGSRLLLRMQTLVNKGSWTLLGHLCFAIGKHGKPKRIRTDNERVFTGFVFTTFLKLAGIDH